MGGIYNRSPPFSTKYAWILYIPTPALWIDGADSIGRNKLRVFPLRLMRGHWGRTHGYVEVKSGANMNCACFDSDMITVQR